MINKLIVATASNFADRTKLLEVSNVRPLCSNLRIHCFVLFCDIISAIMKKRERAQVS